MPSRVRAALLSLALAVCLTACAAAPTATGQPQESVLGKLWRLVLGGLIGLVTAVVLKVPIMGGFLVGAGGAGGAMALEPSHPANVTQVKAENGSHVNLSVGGGASHGFLGVPPFWWGVIAAWIVPQLWHNRDDIKGVIRGEYPGVKAKVSVLLGHVLAGLKLPEGPAPLPPAG